MGLSSYLNTLLQNQMPARACLTDVQSVYHQRPSHTKTNTNTNTNTHTHTHAHTETTHRNNTEICASSARNERKPGISTRLATSYIGSYHHRSQSIEEGPHAQHNNSTRHPSQKIVSPHLYGVRSVRHNSSPLPVSPACAKEYEDKQK